jgi:hypothetical protein
MFVTELICAEKMEEKVLRISVGGHGVGMVGR